MSKVAIVCTGCGPKSIYPSFVFGSAAAALGDEVILFVCPAAAPAMRAGELEKIQVSGMPDLSDLVSGFKEAGGRIQLCELAFETQSIELEELREAVEVVGVNRFLVDTQDGARTFCL